MNITKLAPLSQRASTRGSITSKSIFLRIMQPSIKHLVSAINSSINSRRDESTPGPKPQVSEADVCKFIGAVVEICGRRVQKKSTYFSLATTTYSTHQWQKIRHHISSYNPRALFRLYNDGLRATIIVGGHGAHDENIWEFFGESSNSVVIPRKPHSTGIRGYLWCFTLTLSGRPVVIFVLPDIRTPCFTGTETLNILLKKWPTDTMISTTADSFFCNLEWLRNHPSNPSTFAVPADHFPFTDLMAKDLKWHEYRVFTNGRIILSFWLDNKLVITASSAFVATPPQGAS